MTTLIQTSTPWLSAEWQLGTQERTLLSCLLLFLKEPVSIISPTWSVFFPPPSHLLIWFGGLRCDEWANANLSLYHTRVKRLTWQELRRATMSCSTAGWMEMCDKDQYLAGSSPQHELKSRVTVLAWDSSTWWHTARTGRLSQPSSLTCTTPSRNLPRARTSPPAWRLQKQTSLILQLALQASTFRWNFTMYNLSLGCAVRASAFYEPVPPSISAYQRYEGAASESLQLCFCVTPGKSVNNSKLIHNHFRDSVICKSRGYFSMIVCVALGGHKFCLNNVGNIWCQSLLYLACCPRDTKKYL